MFGTVRGGVQWRGLLQTLEVESIPVSIKMSGAGSDADGVTEKGCAVKVQRSRGGFYFLFPTPVFFHALEKAIATHSSVLAWRIPGTGEPGGLPSMGSHRVGHN